MKLSPYTKKPETFHGDLAVWLVRQENKEAKAPPACESSVVRDFVDRVWRNGDFTGKEGQTLLFYPESAGKTKSPKRILVVGLGGEALQRESMRAAGGTLVSAALKTKARRILVVIPETPELALDEAAECLAEGVLLGAYRFRRYKTKSEEDEEPRLSEILFHAADPELAWIGLRRGELSGRMTNGCRDMANEPANAWTPAHCAEHARELATRLSLSCRILTRDEMLPLAMGGILGVGQGSVQAPTLSILEYRSGRKNPTILLVGKGLTFDSGGISIKPAENMADMKYDMCGAAAVLAAMEAIAEERPGHVNVIGMVPAAENLPGSAAIKPGDVIRQYGGKTVEVINTDAEGRLLLADALAYGIEQYRPDAVVDVATLTGAVVVGLGHHRTGMLASDDNLAEKLLAAGARAGEPLWRLPLVPEYRKQLKSEVADLKNVGGRDGGAISAACFLWEFAGKTPWAHLDIAGTAWNYTEKSYIPKGPSGIAVRTLLELIRGWKP